MSKAIIGGVAGLVAVLAIGGVFATTASGSDSWQDDLRADIRADFNSDPESQEGCVGIGLIGAESPEELADTLSSFGANDIEEEYGELPDGVTPDEALDVVTDEIWNLCDL